MLVEHAVTVFFFGLLFSASTELIYILPVCKGFKSGARVQKIESVHGKDRVDV